MEVIKYIFTHFWAWLGLVFFVVLVIQQVRDAICQCIKTAKKKNEIVYSITYDTFEKCCSVLDEIGIKYKDDNGYYTLDKVLQQISNKWDKLGEDEEKYGKYC